MQLRTIQLTSRELTTFLRTRDDGWDAAFATSEDCRPAGHFSGVHALKAQIEKLESAISESDFRGTFWQNEAETAAARASELEAEILTLKEALEQAQITCERLRQEAGAAAKQAHELLAELLDVTSELVAIRCEAVQGLR